MSTVNISATIPVVQYGNLSPTFEAEGDTPEEAWANGLRILKQMWDSVAAKPLQLNDVQETVPVGTELTCWASGTKVFFDPIHHVYSPGKWLSGSAFAGKFTPDFPGAHIAGKMALKNGVPAADILDMWQLNAEASSTFGTAVHAALQLYGTYANLSRAVKEGSTESALTKNPMLRPIVEAFFNGREDESAVYEAFVADPILKHCGLIDRLLVLPSGAVRVQDFKTNSDLTKKETIHTPFKGVVEGTTLGAYWLQLSFYASILQAHGFVVEGLDIFHWDGSTVEFFGEKRPIGWVTYSHDVVDISKGLAA